MVTRVVTFADESPYEVVLPYRTCEVEGWSVVHEIVADVVVMFDAATAEMTGPLNVENVILEETADAPAEFAEDTLKL